MSHFLGIDTSNYTTSVALADENGKIVFSRKKLLEVEKGNRGLRQSDAVFAHIKNLPELCSGVRGYGIKAVGVSAFPRDVKGSYMPCFLSGLAAAESAASVLDVPIYKFSHQRGHIRAALYSAGREDLIGGKYAAFHISGGTSEILLVDNGKIDLIGGTLDLNAGQAIDRAGVLMGMRFPCGGELSLHAEQGAAPESPRVSVHGLYCNLSGLENKVRGYIDSGVSVDDISAYVIEFIKKTLDKLCEGLREDYPGIEIVFAGGVASNKRISEFLKKKYSASFAEPVYSSDNACGISLLTFDMFKKEN